MKTLIDFGFFPLSFGCVLLLLYFFDHSAVTLFAAGLELGMAVYSLIDFFQLRHAGASRLDKVFDVRVDAATFDRLQLMAVECGVLLQVFCSCCLACVDPDELAAADPRKEVPGNEG